MSTTPDPTPVDPTPFDPTLAGAASEPTRVDGPLGAEPELLDTPLRSDTFDAVPDDLPPATGQRDRGADTTATLRQAELKAFYAAAGATEVVVGAVRGTLTETQRWASERLAELRFRRAELADQAEEMRQRAEGLPQDVKAVPQAAKGRAAELQEQATSTYAGLAGRGQRVLQGVRADVVNRIDPVFDRLQERVDAARKAIRGAAASAVPPADAPVPTAPSTLAADDLRTEADLLDEEIVGVEEIVVDNVVVEPLPRTDEGYQQER